MAHGHATSVMPLAIARFLVAGQASGMTIVMATEVKNAQRVQTTYSQP